MTFFCAMPGDSPPPYWLAFIVGFAVIGYGVYRCKMWHDDGRAAGDSLIIPVLFLAGGVIVVYGVMLLFHR